MNDEDQIWMDLQERVEKLEREIRFIGPVLGILCGLVAFILFS